MIEAVEAIGGMQAEGRCEPRLYKIKLPDSEGNFRTHDKYTTGCGQESKFIIPYRMPALKQDDDHEAIGLTVCCAVCDDMGRWPRFAHTIKEDSY